MGELVVTALRFGFLILLWIMIISIVSATAARPADRQAQPYRHPHRPGSAQES